MRRTSIGVWELVVALTGCGAGGSDAELDAAVDAPPAIDAPACPAPRTIYLNRGGGTYTNGDNDSSANTTAIVDAKTTIAAPAIAPADWSAFVACLQAKFAPFDVTFTEQDPGAAEHTELAVITSATEIGLSRGVTGVSPFLCDDGPVFFERGIVFLMWADIGNNPDRCWTGAQILGNSFGLDHAFSCPDVMTYLTTCGADDAKTFTDADVPCGETAARACTCGGATQSSFQRLRSTLGLACP